MNFGHNRKYTDIWCFTFNTFPGEFEVCFCKQSKQIKKQNNISEKINEQTLKNQSCYREKDKNEKKNLQNLYAIDTHFRMSLSFGFSFFCVFCSKNKKKLHKCDMRECGVNAGHYKTVGSTNLP